jgi:hypothetical protein
MGRGEGEIGRKASNSSVQIDCGIGGCRAHLLSARNPGVMDRKGGRVTNQLVKGKCEREAIEGKEKKIVSPNGQI